MAKNRAAVSLGRLGGKARAVALSPAERAQIATKASAARKSRKGWPKGIKRTPKA